MVCADAFCGTIKAVSARMATQAAEKQDVVFMGMCVMVSDTVR